ncbi:MAG: uracil-DNA glycosylase [Pseudomonadota bacterium]
MDTTEPSSDLRATAEAYLDWHMALGVDLGVGDTACDWYDDAAGRQAPSAERAPRSATAAPATPPMPAGPRAASAPSSRAPVRPPAATPAPDEAALAAREAAASAPGLAALEASLAAFNGCGLKATAKSLCFARGAADARLMVVGEAPGRDEDLAGQPFVGPAGQLLDKMLAAIGLGEAETHITNIVYWRPPGNRNPTPQETLVCRPFLERQIALVKPEVLMILGRPAANTLLENTQSIMKQRGTWKTLEVAGVSVAAIPTLHPAYLLRTPLAKKMAWRDLQAVRAKLDEEET